MADDDIAMVEIRSGVNEKGEGFNTVVVTTTGGRMLLGQIPPTTVRSMALDWLGAAEAAETDGIVFRLLSEKFGLEPPVVAAFINDMREARE